MGNDHETDVTDASYSRQSGHVKWFNSAKGFGFILLADGREAYLPYTSLSSELQKRIEDDLGEGLAVECDILDTEQGLRARHIVISERSESGAEAQVNAKPRET